MSTAGWYPVASPPVPLTLARRDVISFPGQGLRQRVRIAYAHAYPDSSLSGGNTPGRISPLSPFAEFTPASASWLANLRWDGTDRDNPAPAVVAFVSYPDGPDSNWWCSLSPWNYGNGFFFPLRGPGDFLQGGHRGNWGPGNWDRYENWPRALDLPAPAAAPGVVLHDLPNEPFEVAYSYRVINGETALSPVTAIPYGTGSFTQHAPATLKLLAPTPPGVYGLYLYVRHAGETQWHRQPWLLGRECWPSWVSEIHLTRFVESGIAPAPAVAPECWLNDLQARLAFDDVSDVTTDADEMPLVCPIVSPQKDKARTFGGRWGKVRFVVPTAWEGRTVPREWDCVCQEEASGVTWRNFVFRGDQQDVNAFAGWASHSYSAGNCFSPVIEGTEIIPNGSGFDVGLCVSKYSNGDLTNDHTCSELVARGAYFGAHVNVSIAGEQSVNFDFDRVGVYGWLKGNGPDSAAYHFDVQGGQFVVGTFDPSNHATVFAIDSTATVFVSDLFADGIGRALVTLGPSAGGAVLFPGAGKINCNKTAPYKLNLVEQPASRESFTLDLGRCHGQDNGNVLYALLAAQVGTISAKAAPGAFYDNQTVQVAA